MRSDSMEFTDGTKPNRRTGRESQPDVTAAPSSHGSAFHELELMCALVCVLLTSFAMRPTTPTRSRAHSHPLQFGVAFMLLCLSMRT